MDCHMIGVWSESGLGSVWTSACGNSSRSSDELRILFRREIEWGCAELRHVYTQGVPHLLNSARHHVGLELIGSRVPTSKVIPVVCCFQTDIEIPAKKLGNPLEVFYNLPDILPQLLPKWGSDIEWKYYYYYYYYYFLLF